MNKNYIKNMVLISFGAVLMTFCSWLTVPFVLPFTLQTLGFFVLLQTLGGKKGVCSVCLYTVLGIFGIPVFSGFGAGIGVLLGPTGGFLLGFVVAGVLYCLLETLALRSMLVRFAVLSCCQLVCYLCGVCGYMLWASGTDTHIGLISAASVCVLPYLIPDALKLVLSVYVSKRLLKAVKA